jgi:hypothetical protein
MTPFGNPTLKIDFAVKWLSTSEKGKGYFASGLTKMVSVPFVPRKSPKILTGTSITFFGELNGAKIA